MTVAAWRGRSADGPPATGGRPHRPWRRDPSRCMAVEDWDDLCMAPTVFQNAQRWRSAAAVGGRLEQRVSPVQRRGRTARRLSEAWTTQPLRAGSSTKPTGAPAASGWTARPDAARKPRRKALRREASLPRRPMFEERAVAGMAEMYCSGLTLALRRGRRPSPRTTG
jgi:hypothetical protein